MRFDPACPTCGSIACCSKPARFQAVLWHAQDHDGSHIKGLLINFIHCYWPSLLRHHSFLCEFVTPIVKVLPSTIAPSPPPLTIAPSPLLWPRTPKRSPYHPRRTYSHAHTPSPRPASLSPPSYSHLLSPRPYSLIRFPHPRFVFPPLPYLNASDDVCCASGHQGEACETILHSHRIQELARRAGSRSERAGWRGGVMRGKVGRGRGERER